MNEHDLRHGGPSPDPFHETLRLVASEISPETLLKLYAVHETYDRWNCAARSRGHTCCAEVMLEVLTPRMLEELKEKELAEKELTVP